jgi:uncharacterized protein YqcC (DUF446 family)
MSEERELKEKISEVKEELKKTGLLKLKSPGWVTDFENKEISSHQDFADWLQFIYLPNLVQKNDSLENVISKNYVALQARKFFSEDVKKGKLLQLLIELDSLQ